MPELPFIHLAPKDVHRTGIASYANTLHAALSKYAPSLSLVRVDASEFLRHLSSFPQHGVVWAELGVNEGETFRALRLQKRLRPGFKRLITIHDSPRFVHSPFQWLESFGTSLWRRASRRAFNLAFEPLILRQALQDDDAFICLTKLGRDALQRRLQKRLRRNVLVHFLPHVLYLDEPLSERRQSFSNPAHIGFFGFITPNKGLHLLIDAAVSLKQTHREAQIPNLIIRGSASASYTAYLDELKRKVQQAELTDKIHFGDFVPEQELPTFLSEIDFLALPYDSPPVIAASGVLQWARTYGVPVVASATPAFSSLVAHNRDGILIPSPEFPTWADFFIALSTERIRIESFSEGIKACQKEASWQSVSEKVMQIVSRLD